jgi:hypothetical protein|tara:strand:+ start:11013 stop:11234 length:222 start_codon:yes stop_codon:yes gene_type:complete
LVKGDKMNTQNKLSNEMIESVGRIQKSLGITPNKEQAEVLTKELQLFIERYLEFRNIDDIPSENEDENLVLRY